MVKLQADLIAADVEVGAGEDGDDLLQHGFQEFEHLLLARAVHVLVHAPVVGRLRDLLRACARKQPGRSRQLASHSARRQ